MVMALPSYEASIIKSNCKVTDFLLSEILALRRLRGVKFMRLIRFYRRFKNQYRIHGHWASIWFIIKMSWIQSKIL